VRDAEGYRALTKSIPVTVTGRLVHQAWVPYTRWHMECQLMTEDIASASVRQVNRGDA